MKATSDGTTVLSGLSRRGALTGAALAGTSALLATSAAPAVSAAPASGASAQLGEVFDVVLEPGELDVPEEVSCGVVTYRVSTTVTEGRSLLLVRLAEGVTVERYLELLSGTNAETPEERIEAAKAVAAAAENLGGAVVTAETPAGFSQVLSPGTYLLVNYGYVGGDAPTVQEIRATGSGQDGYPNGLGTFLHRDTASGVELAAMGPLKAQGMIAVVNTTGTPQEAVLCRVEEGTTTEDMEAYFGALREGEQPPMDPILEVQVGMAPVASGGWSLLHTEFTPGPYVLFSYTVDHETGYNHALEGVFRLVDLV